MDDQEPKNPVNAGPDETEEEYLFEDYEDDVDPDEDFDDFDEDED